MSTHKCLYVARSEFPDRQSGKMVRNCKIQYISDGHIDDENQKGLPVLTAPCDFELFKTFQKLPADYDLEFSVKPDSKGKPQLHVAKASLIEQK